MSKRVGLTASLMPDGTRTWFYGFTPHVYCEEGTWFWQEPPVSALGLMTDRHAAPSEWDAIQSFLASFGVGQSPS